MCSIEYLSKKADLQDGLYKTQLSLFEELKKYDILKKEPTNANILKYSNDNKSELNVVSFDNQEKSRNQSIKDNLKMIEQRLEKILKIDLTKLNELKKKYELSVKMAIEQTQLAERIESKSQHLVSELSMINKNVVDENIKEVHTSSNSKAKQELDETEKTISIQSLQPDIPKVSVTNPKVTEVKGQMKLDLSPRSLTYNTVNSPMISPRVRDSRDRMNEKIGNDTDSGDYFNDENLEVKEPSPDFFIDSYLKIFDEIHKSMKSNGNYQNIYLFCSRTPGTIENQLFKNTKNLIQSNSTCQSIPFQELVRFMLYWLPKFSVILNVDILSMTGDPNFRSLIDRKPQISFEQLNSKIISNLCTSTDSNKLWIALIEHFQILIQDNFLNIQEIADIFTPLLVPLSSKNDNRVQMLKLLEWLLTLMKEKYKVHEVDSKSVQEITMFSDEDSMNVSSMTENVDLKKQENAITYNQLKQSLNLADHSKTCLLEDDDPNADINFIFTTSMKNPGNSELNESKDRLMKSIRNIEDDFVYTLPDWKEPSKSSTKVNAGVENADSDSDSDFDFYK